MPVDLGKILKSSIVDEEWTLGLSDEVINCHFCTKSAGPHLVRFSQYLARFPGDPL
jgi:hypothetical protein